MHSRLFGFSSLLVFLLVLLPSAVFAQDVLRLHGSNVLGQRIAPILVTGWMRKIGYTGLRTQPMGKSGIRISATRDGESLDVEIIGNGGTVGFQDLVNGDAELALMARPLTAREIDDGWQLGRLDSPDQEFVVALQALSVVVHPGNRVRAISQAQLSAILSGRIRDWRELGGKPGAIRLQLASADSGLGEMQAQLLKTPVSATDVHYRKNGPAIIAAVASDPESIGLVEFGNDLRGLPTLALRVAGRDIPANRLHVMTEDYPLVRRLYFRTGQLVTALGRGFVNYAVSDEGQRALASQGFLALAPSGYRETLDPNLPKDYAALVDGAERMSLSIRFGDAFFLFDSRSTQDVNRLQSFMARPENRKRKILLVGLSGKQSSPYQAISLSNERADLAAQALSELGMHPARVRGFGHVLPISDAGPGQGRNLRVEVWLR